MSIYQAGTLAHAITLMIAVIGMIVVGVYIWAKSDEKNSPTHDERCRGGHDF